MLKIAELGITLKVNDEKEFVFIKDSSKKETKVASIEKEKIRTSLLKMSKALLTDRKVYQNICQNEDCKKTFPSFRANAKWCTNKCRQAIKNKKEKEAREKEES